MTDGKLAKYLAEITDCDKCEASLLMYACMANDELCVGAWEDWLKKEK